MCKTESLVKLNDKQCQDFILNKKKESQIVYNIAKQHYPPEEYGCFNPRIRRVNDLFYAIWQHY